MKIGFYRQIFEINQISNLVKMRPEGIELFRTEGRTYICVANSSFTQFYERALKEVSYPCQLHEGI
jgi:hypothetical protein